MVENPQTQEKEPVPNYLRYYVVLLGNMFAYLVDEIPQDGDVLTINSLRICLSLEIHPSLFDGCTYQLTRLPKDISNPEGNIPRFGIKEIGHSS